MQKIEYPDILHEHVYLYFKGDFHYPATVISDSDRWLAGWVKCTRYYLQGAFGESYNDVLAEALQDLSSILFSENVGSKFLVSLKAERAERLDLTNFYARASQLVDYRNAFILISEGGLSDIQNIPIIYRKATDSRNIDYLRLILDFCPAGASICKMSNDGGDDYVAFDIFSAND